MAHSHSAAGENSRRLFIVFVLTALYLLVEVVGGLLTGSLALLADAGHMLTDVAGLGLALFAIRVAARPATPERTYGYYRVEILAALANAVALIGISGYILAEAWQRLRQPPEVASGAMLGVAAVGLVVNVVGILMLRTGSEGSLNVRGAYFEVLSDLLTSVGVIVAGVVMWTTRWDYADPLISAGIGLFILPRTWLLLREAVGILLEGTLSDVSLAAVRATALELPGVAGVHDLDAWALASGINEMSLHVALTKGAEHCEVLAAVRNAVTTGFPNAHVIVQVESRDCNTEEFHA